MGINPSLFTDNVGEFNFFKRKRKISLNSHTQKNVEVKVDTYVLELAYFPLACNKLY